MSFGATYGAISLNNVFNSALYRDIYEILLVRLRAPFLTLFPTVKHPLGTLSLATLCGSIPYPVRVS